MFGRYDHAMTCLGMRYLYIFGGERVIKNVAHQNFFERFDLKSPYGNWELVNFSIPGLPFFRNVSLVGLNQHDLLILVGGRESPQIQAYIHHSDYGLTDVSTAIPLHNVVGNQLQFDFLGVEPVVYQSFHSQTAERTLRISCFDKDASRLLAYKTTFGRD